MSSNEIVFGGQEPAPPSLQEAIESNRRKALFQSISVAANQDPKHVAEAMRYGFSPMAPREALDQERKARNVRKVYDSVLDYPVASSFFQDPAFASIAIKDADNIGILENLARTAVSVPTGLAEAGLSILELTQGQASAFVDYLRIKIKQNAWEHMTPEQRRQFRQQDLARRGLTEYPSEFRPLGEMVTTKMRRGLQELTKDFKPQAKTLFGEALISAGTSIGQFAVLLPFGPAGILTGFGALSFGQGLEAGRQAGLETGDQIRYAAMDAIAEIGFAALPLQRLFASTKSGSSFLRSFWEFSAAEVPAEMATTLTQSFNRWARIDSQRGQSFDDWLSGLGREEALTVLATLMSSAGFSALAHRAQVQITNQAREQGLAEARARGIAQMADRLRELELTSEAPEAARQLMNGILQEASDVDRLRVEASRLAEAIEQVGVDKVRAALPGVVEALQQSGTEPGVEAEISPGDYLVAAAQVPELRAALEPHIRVGDSEYSSAEVEQARAETDAYLSALQQEFDQQVEQARQREADRLQIERNVISQIYGEDAARALTPEQAVPEPEAEAQPEPAQQPEADVASIQAAMDAIPPEVTQVVEQLSEQLAEQAPAEPAVEAPEAVSEASQPVDERQDFLGWFGTSRARTMAGIPARLVESSPGVYTKSGEGTGGVAVSIRAPLELTGRRARRFAESESVRREVLQQAEQSGRDGVVAYVKRRDAAGRTVEETVYAPIKQDQVRPMPASMDITPAVQTQAESIAAPMTDQQIEQLDADYAKAVKRKDWARAKEIVDIFARQMARTVLLAHHGLSEGFLENHSFDPTRLGKFTGAPSARLGFFMSRGSATPRAYAKHNLFPKKRAMDAIRKMADIIGGLYSRANLTPETFRQLVDQLNQSGIIEINKSGWARVSSVASPEVRQLLERELGISPGQEFSFVELKEYLDFAARNSAKPDAIASRWAGRKSMKAKLASIGVLLTTTAANFNQDTFNMTRRHVDTQYAVAQQLNALLQLLKTQAYRSSDVVGEVDADTASRIEQEVDKVAGETNEVYNEIFDIYGEVTTTLNLYAAMNNPLVYNQGGEKFRAKKFFDVIRDAKNAGHDGVIIRNTYDGGPLDDVYVVFNPNQIKSAEAVVLDDNKQVVPPSQRFDVTTTDIRFSPPRPTARVTPEQDATYMEAVESEDTNKQEELVDQAANNAGYNIFAEHQTSEIFTEFKAGEFGFHVGNGIMPGLLGHETMELWVRISNPLRMRDLGVWSPERVIYSLPESLISDRERASLLEDIDEEMRTGRPDSGDMFAYYEAFAPIRQLLKENGYDGIVYKNEAEGGEDSYIAFDPEQLKSADPITYDADGNVIPLSQRFDATQPSILYGPEAPGPRVTPEQIATQARLFSIMFSRLAQTMGVSASDLWSRYGVQILSGQLDGLTGAEQQAALQRPGAYLPKKMTVVLNQIQTASTLIHELSHHWMHVFETVASDLSNEQADAIRQEFQVLLDWFGVKDIAAWQALPASEKASHHETLAYNFEDYLATGKAPTNALRGVFRKIKDWFAGLYSDLRGHLNESYRNEFGKDLPALTEDVRMLFDRMLGSEVAIARAKQTELAMPLFTTRDESGMDEEQWAELQEAQRARDEEAIDKFRAQSVRDIQWSRNAQSRAMRQIQREASERRGEIRKEVETELRSQPVYRAISFLRSGELRNDQNEVVEHEGLHRMNAEVVKDEFGQEVASALGYGKNGMLGKDGLHPDLVASVIGGFQDGSDLVRQLASAKPLQQAVAEISEQLMQQRHAELVDPKLIEAAAANAIRNQHHVRFLTKVLRFVSRATQPESVMALAAKYAARRTLERMTIRDIRPDRFSQAERRTGKEANKAWKSGDEALTINLLRRQLGQAQLANESRVVREEVDKLVKYLRRLSSANKRKSVGADYADYIDMVLGKVVVDKVQLADLPARAEPKTLADYASEAQSESFATVATPEYVAELSAMQATDYRDMRYEQLLELVDLVKEIEHRGRLKHQGKMEFLQQSQQEVVASLTGAVIANAPETKGEPSVTEQSRSFEASRAFYKYGIQQTTMATKAWVMDGGDYGPWFDLMVNTSSKLMDLEIARRAEHTQKLEQILMPLFGSPLYGTGQFRERLGRRMNTQEMFILACNLGNEGNIQRLQDGNGFDINDVMAEISESLTAEQLRAVQDVWDVFNALKPEIAKMERDTRNSEPIWVEPRPITLRSSDGQSVHLRGGYFPIVYDPIASTESMSLKDKEALESEIRQANAASATRQTYTKQRASRVVNRPLLFSMSNVYGSLEEIIHDLTWRKWSTDMNRVLGDRSKLSKAILNSYGEIWLRDIMDWKNRLIVDDVRAKTEFGGKIVAYAARYASSASLLYNIGSILIQPLGALTIRAATGGRAARAGLAKYLANPSEAHREAREKSPALEMRYLTRMREFADLETRIQGKSDFRRTMEVFGWQLMAKTQSIADTIAWHSGYAMAIEKGNSEARAADIAYQVVLDTQSSGRTADLSTLETGAPWKRMFAVFYRVMNTQLNLAMRSIKDRNKATASKILDMTSIFVVMPYITYLLKDLITPDEEDDPEFWTIGRQAGILASETFQSAIGSFWFIRDAAALGRLFEGETPYAYRGPTGLRIIPDFFKLVEQISQGEMDKTLMKSASSFLGDVTGAPAAAINRMIDGFSAMMEGKDVPAYSILTGTQR